VTQSFLAHERGLVEGFFDVVAATDGPSVTAFLQHTATREQMLEFLVHRTVYQLKEADPHAFAVPRLTGTPKARLVEILFDEYGGGRPDRLHATMFAQTLVACGLDPRYGAYLDRVPAVVLAVNNAMSLFGLHRRLRGAAMGHLAAFEATSSIPARRISRGLRRLGFPEVAADYFDEHVEADAVHEQLAVRGIVGSLLRQDPHLAADVAFGAAASLCLDGLAASSLLERWQRGESGLRTGSPVPTLQA
jgi:pyrroloquinoline quinone (PQQ) biosynthesis protein C